MKEKINILHILFVSNNKTSGVRNVVPKYLEYQSKIANVALLNCNNTEVPEAKDIYKVFKLSELNNKKISNLPAPYNKPDLVVFHSIYYPQYIKLYKECKKEKIPYVVVPHGSLTKQAQKQKIIKKIPANILLFNGFINNAVAVQYLIEGEKEKSKHVKKYIINGNGIELIRKEKKYTSQENKEFKYIYIGRYDTYTKGLDLLINAIALIKEELLERKIKFLLYGTDYRGREKQIIALIEKNNLDNIVELNGPVWGQEKIEKMLEADVFIQPSRTEGQPIGLMEAISIGLPCIATKETNYGEIIKNNHMGWQIKADSKDIAKKILEAYDNREKFSTITKIEREYAKNNFEWNKITIKTIEEYKDLIEQYKEKKC